MPTLLWANLYCLLDTSSGASMTVRRMLHQLVDKGWDVHILGATIFDHPSGKHLLGSNLDTTTPEPAQIIRCRDGPLTHHLIRTERTDRGSVTAREEGVWFNAYSEALERISPDIVFYYGGKAFDFLIPYEARRRGVPSAAYVANGNFKGRRWCADTTALITTGHATARYYQETFGFNVQPVGPFIRREEVVAEKREAHGRVLFVNPCLEKGAAIVVRLAQLLEARRSDILFEVVESRGNWQDVLRVTTAQFGLPRDGLSNVVVTPHVDDMRPVYARARLLLAPSLWWESYGRVAVEATLNGIPAIVTNRGGLPEAVGEGGICMNFPKPCYEKPYTSLPKPDQLAPIAQKIEQLFDDEAYYGKLSAKARGYSGNHNIDKSTDRLEAVLLDCISSRDE